MGLLSQLGLDFEEINGGWQAKWSLSLEVDRESLRQLQRGSVKTGSPECSSQQATCDGSLLFFARFPFALAES